MPIPLRAAIGLSLLLLAIAQGGWSRAALGAAITLPASDVPTRAADPAATGSGELVEIAGHWVENPFPTRAMAEQFSAYLAWTKRNGLSRLAVFEPLPADRLHTSATLSTERLLPTPVMVEQFDAYLRWIRTTGLSRFYAFAAVNYD